MLLHRFLLILIALFYLNALQAQSFEFEEETLAFPTTTTGSTASDAVQLTNLSSETLTVTDYRFFKTFGTSAFAVPSTQGFPNFSGSEEILLQFSPSHNVEHPSIMVVSVEGRGSRALSLAGAGQYADSFYDSTFNLSEQDLKLSLRDLAVIDYQSLGYDTGRDILYMQVDNEKVNGQEADVNTITGVYTGEVREGYQNRGQLQSMGFNCEHSWPQSLGAENEPMKSDLYHLYPTESTANSVRGNSPFGNVDNPEWSEGGSEKGGGRFEPRDEQKGPTSRSLLYFATRYFSTSGVDFTWLTSQEQTLKNWSKQYPPTQAEIDRSEIIQNFQGNRNPFIDHPEFVDRITSFANTSFPIANPKIFVSDEVAEMGFLEAGSTYEYSIVIYNEGNQFVSLTNFDLGDQNLASFKEPVSNVNLSPGSLIEIFVVVTPESSDPAIATITFNTNISGQQDREIPILINGATGINDFEEQQIQLELYPNPTTGSLRMKWDPGQIKPNYVRLFDVSGSLAFERKIDSQSSARLNLSSLAKGSYFLQLEHDRGQTTQRLVID